MCPTDILILRDVCNVVVYWPLVSELIGVGAGLVLLAAVVGWRTDGGAL